MKARRWLTGLAMVLGCTVLGAAGAQPFPDKPVRIIAPTAAGSAPDIITRLIADRLGRQWGHQVIVENRPGGNGIIGMNALTRADPDGYTLAMFHAAAAVTTPFLYQAAKFDIERDTEVVATLAYTPMMLVTTPGTPYRSVADLIAAAASIVLSWLYMNMIFALHYAHGYYGHGNAMHKGLDFPGTDEPDYWDFAYFALVLGMTFQVSDVQIVNRRVRRTALTHSVIAFFFNVFIIAISVNVAAGRA